jgi:DNA polymerase III subunit epsilon
MTINPRAHAIQTARQKLELQPLYLDTETTGTDKTSEIIEICIIDHDGAPVYQSLVKPTVKIPTQTTQIHGITNEMVNSAPPWYRVWPEVETQLAGRAIGIYNAEFDLRMIQQTHAKYRMPWRPAQLGNAFCIMKLYAQFYGEWDPVRGSYRWQSLEAAGKQLKIPLRNTHRALDDTLLAREVLQAIARTESQE